MNTDQIAAEAAKAVSKVVSLEERERIVKSAITKAHTEGYMMGVADLTESERPTPATASEPPPTLRDCGNDTKRLDWLIRNGYIYANREAIDAAMLETDEKE